MEGPQRVKDNIRTLCTASARHSPLCSVDHSKQSNDHSRNQSIVQPQEQGRHKGGKPDGLKESRKASRESC